ncbi:RNA/RNP complex-1-interacting phosphatase [Excalfactoria chinensis]|uniref:RNA/RNP complex-1-interacting phosphatase n=1 Tax=Excalfactoria chinensis TaxID=46218 RepID=UPI003B3AF177
MQMKVVDEALFDSGQPPIVPLPAAPLHTPAARGLRAGRSDTRRCGRPGCVVTSSRRRLPRGSGSREAEVAQAEVAQTEVPAAFPAAVSMPGRGRCRVPERWTDYVPLGRRLPGTRFIAFKVPLKKSFNHNLHPEERFSPCDLIEKVKEQKEELGLIIDLTYTTRYYGPEELPATLRYSKILTMGHEIPNKQTIFQFKRVVESFLRDNKDNDKLIGVHCTHGLNRTGYLVCRYLIDVEGMEPNAAIELFNRARGHPIERMNYIEDLQRRSGMKREVKNLGSVPIKQRVDAVWNSNKQKAENRPQRSEHLLLTTSRNSICAKKKKKQHDRVADQHREFVHKPGTAEKRWPCSLGQRNCSLSMPSKKRHNETSFLPPNPLHQQPQESCVARKRRRQRKKRMAELKGTTASSQGCLSTKELRKGSKLSQL